ncbi:daunorubicin/doxorubicin resistance ABC transporter ATP-binding protein DrrA, partial [Priestia sp. SIMBA_032]
LHDGRIAAVGTPAELKARIGGDTVELHDGDGALSRRIPTDGTVADLRRALDLLDEEGADGVVTLRRPTLDDVFLAVTSPTSTSRPVK